MRERFEAAILANPDDLAGYAAFADWLAEQGDPRGEFIRVQLALEDEALSARQRKALRKRESELLAAHMGDWLGPLGPLLAANEPVQEYVPRVGLRERPNYDFRFARGFLDSLHVRQFGFPAARALRDSRATRFLRELAIDSDVDPEQSERPRRDDGVPGGRSGSVAFPTIYPLLRADFANLRRFRLGGEDDTDGLLDHHAMLMADYGFALNPAGVQCHVYCAAVPDLVGRMPRLEELHLLCKEYAIDRLFATRALPKLRVLRVYHFGLRDQRRDRARYEYPLDVLAANPGLANLTHLLFHPHHPEGGYFQAPRRSFLPLEQVRALLRSKHLTKLVHLQLRLSNMGDEGCRAVVESGILRRLRVLDLRHGCVTDAGAEVLAACPDLKNLELLDLSRNGLTRRGERRLRATGVNLVARTQQTPEELAAEAYLFEGDSE